MKKLIILFTLAFPFLLVKGQVLQVEYFFDSDPGYGNGANAGAIELVENQTKKTFEKVTFDAPLTGLADGMHTLYIRAKGNHGWSQTQLRPFIKMSLTNEEANEVKYLEYFIDNDPGYKQGISVNVDDNGGVYTFNVETALLTDGMHTLYVRALNKDNRWSQVMLRPFVKTILPTDLASGLVAVEYYLDADPGTGNGAQIAVPTDSNVLDFTVDLNSVSVGNHILTLRGKNRLEQWEAIGTHSFTVIDPNSIEENLVSEISVYPNPVTDLLFVKNDNGLIVSIELIDISSKVCAKKSAENNASVIQLPLSKYPSGMYILKMNFENETKSVKILKK